MKIRILGVPLDLGQERRGVDMGPSAIRAAGLKLGVDPLGGAAGPYWEPINALYKTNISIVNPATDPS